MPAEDDKVVSRWTLVRFRTELSWALPRQASGLTMGGICIDQIADSKIVAEWEEFDMLNMMQQLGAIPAMRKPQKASAK